MHPSPRSSFPPDASKPYVSLCYRLTGCLTFLPYILKSSQQFTVGFPTYGHFFQTSAFPCGRCLLVPDLLEGVMYWMLLLLEFWKN